jgi:hypothetical protein
LSGRTSARFFFLSIAPGRKMDANWSLFIKCNGNSYAIASHRRSPHRPTTVLGKGLPKRK